MTEENKKEEKTRLSEAELEKSTKKTVHEKPKKKEAVVNAKDIPISTKHSVAICRFIKGKGIGNAITELQQVANLKKPVPIRGEIPHRHGKIMSGRFPQKAAKWFIVLLKSLGANANHNGIENPIISEAEANIGARPFGRHGVRRKRTHITLIARTAGGKNA